MSLINLQQNHSSVHRVTAMTVKGKCLPKDEKNCLRYILFSNLTSNILISFPLNVLFVSFFCI